jgi:hypothetical protein
MENYLCPLDQRDLAPVVPYTEESHPPASLEFLLVAKQIMEDNGYGDMPKTVAEALDLYILLTSTIEQTL